MDEIQNKNIVNAIKELVERTKNKVACQINNKALIMYWNISKMIVDFEKTNAFNEKTARSFILELSKTLTREIGRGYSRSNLFNMRKFYLTRTDFKLIEMFFCE